MYTTQAGGIERIRTRASTKLMHPKIRRMFTMRLRLLLIALVLLVAPMAFGGNYSLNDWCFYVNSLDINHSCSNGSGTDNFLPPVSPGTFDYVHLSDNNTLGTATVTLGAGTYNVFAFFDYDIKDGGHYGGFNE